jgi:hypothetical protein
MPSMRIPLVRPASGAAPLGESTALAAGLSEADYHDLENEYGLDRDSPMVASMPPTSKADGTSRSTIHWKRTLRRAPMLQRPPSLRTLADRRGATAASLRVAPAEGSDCSRERISGLTTPDCIAPGAGRASSKQPLWVHDALCASPPLTTAKPYYRPSRGEPINVSLSAACGNTARKSNDLFA